MTGYPTPTAARRIFLILTWTRWFPVGFVIPMTVLFMLDRGLSVEQTLTATATSGLVVFLLELPTSSFADVVGRRPVYVTAAAVNVLASVAFLVAHTFWAFAAAAALTGVFRALDSGPLEAWFVDALHAAEPDAPVDRHLSAQGTLLGGAIALGALVSGALVWWHPDPSASALLLPVLVATVLSVVHLVTVVVLVREPRRTDATVGLRRLAASVTGSGQVIRESLGLLRADRVLLGLLAVEACWSIAMIVFEQLTPVRLAELVGSQARAGGLTGPLTAAAWAVFAAGAALAGLASGRIGVTRTAVLARVLNGAGAVAMGLAAGPVVLAAAYLVTYALHGANGPMHAALLHRQAVAANRATVLSMNSLVAFAAFAAGAPLLGVVAAHASTPVAMLVGGAAGVLGAVFYLPARRAERDGRPAARREAPVP